MPERWRRELPLPLWPFGYGAGLGAGVLTYQPVATLWVALAGAAPSATRWSRPLPRAFGRRAPRWRTLPGPARRRRGRLRAAGRRFGRVRRANAVALGACAGPARAAVPAQAATALPLGPGSQLDPAPQGRVLAYTERVAGRSRVVLRVPGRPLRRFVGSSPALSGDTLALVDRAGLRLLRWSDGKQVGRIAGQVRGPALALPYLAFLQARGGRTRLVVVNLETGRYRVLTSVAAPAVVGRPSLSGTRVLYTVTRRTGSRVLLAYLGSGRRRVLAESSVGGASFAALTPRFAAWVEQRPGGRSALVLRPFAATAARPLLEVEGAAVRLWSTALVGRTAYVTRWSTRTGRARVLRFRF